MKSKVKKQTVKKITIKVLSRILAAVIFLASIPAVSAIPFRNSFEQMDIINHQTKELNLDLLARIQIILDQSQFNMANYIPTQNLPKNDNGEVIGRHILQQTVKTLLENESNSTAAGIRNINNLNSSLSATMNQNGHSVAFRFKAVETTAEVNYKGFVSATLAYDVGRTEATLEVSKNIGQQTYAYTHTDNSDGHSDIVGVRWNF